MFGFLKMLSLQSFILYLHEWGHNIFLFFPHEGSNGDERTGIDSVLRVEHAGCRTLTAAEMKMITLPKFGEFCFIPQLRQEVKHGAILLESRKMRCFLNNCLTWAL